MSPYVSIVIPVFNAEKTLRRCVESLLFGKERNIQIILSEDCSSDNSWAVCQSLCEEHSEVHAIRNKKNSGVSHTRNRALACATGEFVLFVDSDDWVSQNYVDHLLRGMKTFAERDLVLCGYHYINKVTNARAITAYGKENISFIPSTDLFSVLEKTMLQQLWNKIFRRDIIEKYQIRFDETQSMGEDFQFVLDYMEAAKIQRCVILNEPLYYYIRWNSNSLMSKFGLAQRSQEYERAEQLHRISGLESTAQRDALIDRSRKNYVYYIARNSKLTKSQKLDAIEQIIGGGYGKKHYRRQRRMYAKERLAAALPKIKQLPARAKGRLGRKKIAQVVNQIRDQIQADNFTVISQNCIGGVLYHDLGMEFQSPTVNTFIREPDFVRMVLNLRYYTSLPIVMRWEEEYPVGMLDDIVIHFMHYETCEEAKNAWERRVKRINWDKIIVLSTDRDGFDTAVYEQWKQIPYPKVLFTARPEFTEDSVYYPEYSTDRQVGDLISERKFYRGNKIAATLRT